MNRCALLAAIGFSLTIAHAEAATWSGSYAADGRCYCIGTLDPALARKIVPTPLGGQSVRTVCARIGAGPGLSAAGARFQREVYADPQCGHGPFLTSGTDSGTACGRRDPARDCRSDPASVGPRWDLDAAYSRRVDEAVDEVVRQSAPAGTIGPVAALPILAAGLPLEPRSAADRATAPRSVFIDGRRWRLAPPGTPEKGAPGSRIVLDDRVYLAAKDAATGTAESGGESEGASATATLGSAAAGRVLSSESDIRAGRLKPVGIHRVVDASLDRLRTRSEALMQEARERIRGRQARRSALPSIDAAADDSPDSEPRMTGGTASSDASGNTEDVRAEPESDADGGARPDTVSPRARR